ncbi:DUF1129 domain-containing protein [uncultured Lactococcus sp.]|jgi:uncharacterized membrane-anchored protein|uniref:DUF1129 domain-containing protein n=1 Tax=uncultured Lactococcus sp. TaxID=167973 RepID=UPI0007B2E382|nr:DUF1129 domain-containing protein [uncultured Lactococcus sp.]KZK38127.1 Integral membrane protein [Lactococcus cremoris]
MENLIEELTAKNKEYIHSVTKQLILVGKSDEEVKAILNDILPQIIEGQKSGIIARKLLGAPTEFVQQYQPKVADKPVSEKNENPGLMWLDSSLLFLGFISLLNGVMALFTSNSPVYGFVTVILSAAVAGLVMYLMYRFFYRPKADGVRQKWNWKGFLATTLSVLLWIAVTIFSGLLPVSINVQLPALALIIVGVVALGLRWLLKRQFNIQSALVAQPRR